MRKTCLAVIPVVLLSGAPLAAQQAKAPVRTISVWAVNYSAAPPPRDAAAAPPAAYLPVPSNSPVTIHPPQPAPVAAHPQPGCADGHCGDHKAIDWQHLREWLCYRSIKGGCPKKGSCGCNCSIPLYVYFLHDCKEGRCHELPPCVAEAQTGKPHLFRRMFEDATSLFRSGGASSPCCAVQGGCGVGHGGQ